MTSRFVKIKRAILCLLLIRNVFDLSFADYPKVGQTSRKADSLEIGSLMGSQKRPLWPLGAHNVDSHSDVAGALGYTMLSKREKVFANNKILLKS